MSTTSVFGDRTRPQMMKGLIMFGTSLCLHSNTEQTTRNNIVLLKWLSFTTKIQYILASAAVTVLQKRNCGERASYVNYNKISYSNKLYLLRWYCSVRCCAKYCLCFFLYKLAQILLWKIPAVDYSSSEASMSAVLYTDNFQLGVMNIYLF